MLTRVDMLDGDIAELEAHIDQEISPSRQRSTGWMRSPGLAASPRR